MRLVGFLVCFVAVLSSAAMAQKVPPQKRAPVDDPVFVFNRVCYSKVPNLDAIRDMATKLAWQPIKAGDLKKFTQIKEPEVLEGWDAQVGERIFRMAVVQSPPPAGMLKSFPAFEGGRTTSCTMVVDEGYPADVITSNMQTLARKEPVSKDVDEGFLKTTTWAGGNDKLKVFLVAKVGRHGTGGVLSVTVLQK